MLFVMLLSSLLYRRKARVSRGRKWHADLRDFADPFNANEQEEKKVTKEEKSLFSLRGIARFPRGDGI